MEGGTLGPAAFADPEPCATVAALKEAQAAVDRRLLKVVEALDGAGLQRIVSVHRGTSIQRERMDRLLLHLFQHDIHHRGQAHAMLSATSVTPPQLDEFFSVGEAPLRAGEFAELGWTEHDLGQFEPLRLGPLDAMNPARNYPSISWSALRRGTIKAASVPQYVRPGWLIPDTRAAPSPPRSTEPRQNP